jgi:hypothetical protein
MKRAELCWTPSLLNGSEKPVSCHGMKNVEERVSTYEEIRR